MQLRAPGRVPEPAAELGDRVEVVAGAEDRHIDLVARLAQRIGTRLAAGRQRGEVARNLHHHIDDALRRVARGEPHLADRRVGAVLATEVREAAARELGVGDHLDAPHRADVHRPPVDLLDLASHARGIEPVPELEGLLEEQEQSRQHRADGVLQGKADDDRSDAEGREEASDIRAPDHREEQGERDDDHEEAHDIHEDRRQSLAPGAHARGREHGEVDAVDEHEDHQEAENGRRDPAPRDVDVEVAGLAQQHEQRGHRHDVVADQAHDAGGAAAPAHEGGVHLGEADQDDRQTDHDEQ